MKNLLLCILVCLCCAPLEAVGKNKMLWAIAEVETRNDYRLIGKSGERSEFQFMKNTWHQHTQIEFEVASMAIGRSTVRRVADSHLDWIIRYLRERGHPVTAYNISLIWNGGAGNFHRNTLEQRHRDYARRVSALYGVKIVSIDHE